MSWLDFLLCTKTAPCAACLSRCFIRAGISLGSSLPLDVDFAWAQRKADHDIGLDSFSMVALAGARMHARETRSKILEGLGPVVERRKIVDALRDQQGQSLTSERTVELFIEVKSDEWRNAEHRTRLWARCSSPTSAPPMCSRCSSLSEKPRPRPRRSRQRAISHARQRCRKGFGENLPLMCRIPDDCISENRYPLFMARAVMRGLTESMQTSPEVRAC